MRVRKVWRVLCKVQVRMLRDHGCIPNNVHHIRRRNLPIEPGKGGKFCRDFSQNRPILGHSCKKGNTKMFPQFYGFILQNHFGDTATLTSAQFVEMRFFFHPDFT